MVTYWVHRRIGLMVIILTKHDMNSKTDYQILGNLHHLNTWLIYSLIWIIMWKSFDLLRWEALLTNCVSKLPSAEFDVCLPSFVRRFTYCSWMLVIVTCHHNLKLIYLVDWDSVRPIRSVMYDVAQILSHLYPIGTLATVVHTMAIRTTTLWWTRFTGMGSFHIWHDFKILW